MLEGNWLLGNCLLGNCHLGKCPFGKLIFWETSFWEIISGKHPNTSCLYLLSDMTTIFRLLNTKIAFSFHQFISKQRRLCMIIWKWNIHRIKIVFLKSSKYIHIYRLSFHPGFCLSLHFGKVNCFFLVVPVIFSDFWKCNCLIHSIVNIGKKYEQKLN